MSMQFDYAATNDLEGYFSDRQYEKSVQRTKRQPHSDVCAFEDLTGGDH